VITPLKKIEGEKKSNGEKMVKLTQKRNQPFDKKREPRRKDEVGVPGMQRQGAWLFAG